MVRQIATAKIFPSIGIARLGNSPTGYFVGPERPGDRSVPGGRYKDASCRIKRQAARFRIFGYDATGRLVGEVTSARASITWTVHLANAKAGARGFAGLDPSAPRRNTAPIPGVPPVVDRGELVIDPGPRSVAGTGQHAIFDSGRFLGTPVPLGEIRADAAGRLLVLGGFGHSGTPLKVPLTSFANNDRWFDDVSDGPVTATVRIPGSSQVLDVDPAWVICGPPDFAPAVESVTSLYDALFEVFVAKGWLSAPDPPSLTRDVYPLLRRALAIEATSMMSTGKHGAAFAAAFPTVSAANQADRAKVFAKLNNPNNPDAGDGDMPMLWSDTYTPGQGETLTKVQYEILRRWSDGDVSDDWPGAPPEPARTITPEGLTRAALEACVGGPFYPGIEAGWFLRDAYAYTEPFRLDQRDLRAGDVTKQMALPWQADFTDCTQDGELAWWPAQRPDDVIPEGSTIQVPWTRDIVTGPDDMVRDWHKLGFVVERAEKLVETERYKVCRQLAVVAMRAELSIDEVGAQLRKGGPPARFPACMYVQAEGFSLVDLGIGTGARTSIQLAEVAPRVTLRRLGGRPLPGMRAVPSALLLEDPGSPEARQRATFEYAIELDSTAAFAWRPMGDDVLAATIEAAVDIGGATHRGSALFQLARRPGPFVLDGEVPWASEDLRVFRVVEGERRWAIQMGTGAHAASSFITAVLDQFNGLPAVGHPFDELTAGDSADPLELARLVDGRLAYNFAVARVRTHLPAPADPVRVLFRIFPGTPSGTDYDAATTYRRTRTPAAPVALLGARGGERVSIPCFAAPRVDSAKARMRSQSDDANARTFSVDAGEEAHAYFGCWLDLNQDTPQLPLHGDHRDGPFSGRRLSVQQLQRGVAPSVIAEVYSAHEPVPAGATPPSHPRLAERSVAVVRVAPHRGPAMATAAHPFALRATRRSHLAEGADDADPAIADEVMLLWGDMPAGVEATLYVPGVSIDAMLAAAARRYDAIRLERVDRHTVRCLPADVTYLPLPVGHSSDIPVLLTVHLPHPSSPRETHRVVVHQLAGRRRRVVGTVQVTIVVGAGRGLRAVESRRLSVLRHVAASIPAEDPWRAVTDRHLDLLARRVREAGGDPGSVGPSPDGAVP